MKKIMICLAALCLSGFGAMHAQWSLTPEVGMTAVIAPNGGFKPSYTPSWRLGVGVDYQFSSSRWSASSGLFLTDRLRKTSMSGPSDVFPTPDGGYEMGYGLTKIADYTVAATSFYVPLTMKYTIPLAEKVDLSLSTGFYLGYCFSNKDRNFEQVGHGEETISPSKYNDYFDWGVIFRTGIEVHQWSVAASYEGSFGVESWSQGSHIADRNVFHTVALSVGYRFRLK